MNSTTLSVCILCALLAAAPAAAQAPASRPDPAEAKASVPQASYRSAFADYRGWREEKLADWRGVNDLVASIGGWRVYLREAQQGEPGPSASTKPPTKPAEPAPASVKPAPRGHAGHH